MGPNMIASLKKNLQHGWIFPRFIGIVYAEAALKNARPFARGTMLDIGCGMRRYEPIFAGCVDAYIGLDWPQAADRAHPDIIGDAMSLPVKSGCIDTVLATELMEHLPSPDRFLTEVARILRHGGALILSVPFMEPLHEEPRDFYRFTPYGLRWLMEEHGFSVRHAWSRGGWWSVVLGSFVNQALYGWANPADGLGRRRDGFLTIVVLPLCALAQWSGYQLDRIFHSTRYTLGYTIVAVSESKEGTGKFSGIGPEEME